MIRFLDGPAAGVSLVLGRSPILLRVVSRPPAGVESPDAVIHAGLVWDGLDQLKDAPAPSEAVHVYLLAESHGWVHLDGIRNGRRCGWTEMIADYRHLPEQPAEADVRTNEAWSRWVDANKARLIVPGSEAAALCGCKCGDPAYVCKIHGEGVPRG